MSFRILRLAAILSVLAPNAVAYQAEVENVPPERYCEIALNEIQQAESSIRLYMYLVSLPPNRLSSKVYRLVNALVEAKDRGVEMQVVLDRNIEWTEDNNLGFWNPSGKNGKVYQYLRERGVSVFFDDKATFTHAKVLVIDGETVILGSTNWSESALTRNLETNVLIRSREFAREILEGFETLELHAPALKNVPTIPVPWAFLNDPETLGKMVTAHDESAFDAYLYLLRIFHPNEADKAVLSYESLKAELNFEAQIEKHQRRSVREVLRRLQDKYELIDFSYKRGDENLVVSLRPISDLGTVPGGDNPPRYVRVPLTYWKWGWNEKLTFGGKVMYLLEKLYSALSPMAPIWFRSIRDIARTHGISERFVQDGFMDLRRHNLIEVKADELNFGNYGSRKANRYVSNPLYDPKELAQAFKDLEQRYGKEKVKKAAGYVSLVYEDSDVEAAERLILLEEEFGRKVVEQAVKKVSAMKGSNPKKTVGYLIRTIQGIGGLGKSGVGASLKTGALLRASRRAFCM